MRAYIDTKAFYSQDKSFLARTRSIVEITIQLLMCTVYTVKKKGFIAKIVLAFFRKRTGFSVKLYGNRTTMQKF